MILAYSVLIVDDSSTIRRYLRNYIEQSSDWELCGEAENGQVAVEKVHQLRPDVVILDFQMPIMNGLDAARRIARVSPYTTMFMFTVNQSEKLSEEAQAAGIKFVFSKSDVGPQGLFGWLSTLAVRASST